MKKQFFILMLGLVVTISNTSFAMDDEQDNPQQKTSLSARPKAQKPKTIALSKAEKKNIWLDFLCNSPPTDPSYPFPLFSAWTSLELHKSVGDTEKGS